MKKYLISGFSVLCLVLGFSAVAVFAQAPSTTTTTLTAPMVVNIGPNGGVMLRGEVKSVGTDSLVVKSWGMDWTVKVLTTTQIVTTNKVITDIGVGDFVGVMGDISQDGTFVIDAKIVREWGQKIDSDKNGIPDNQETKHSKDLKGLGDGFFKHFGKHEDGMGNDATQINCLPRPICLDATPKCTVTEPVGGWCHKNGENEAHPPKLPPVVGGTPGVCAQDAKVCSDGSSVGRIGPNCEFAACPEVHGGSSNSGSGSNSNSGHGGSGN